MTQRPFNRVDDRRESRWVSGVGKGVEESGSFFGGKVELARRAICNISGNDTGDFFTEWLDSDYIRPTSVFSSIAIVDRAHAGRTHMAAISHLHPQRHPRLACDETLSQSRCHSGSTRDHSKPTQLVPCCLAQQQECEVEC